MKQLQNIESSQLDSLNIYYGNLNSLITDCVTPVMEQLSSNIKLWFWERSCIGGKHLKIRWITMSKTDTVIKDNLSQTFAEFQAKKPSKPKAAYNMAATRRLIESEKRYVSESDLEEKYDCVASLPYERKADEDATEELIEILHNFLVDTREFCTKLISSEVDRKLICLQLMAVFAIEQFGSLESGSIVFRAHWDNYENWFKPEILPKKIKEHYELNKLAFHQIVQEIMTQHQKNELIKNPMYVEWINILRRYRLLIFHKQEEEVVFMPSATTPEGVIATQNHLNTQNTNSRSEKFLRRLYSESSYLGSLSTNKNLQMTRVMVNLTYHVFSNLGISAFQRMSYCYYLHRSVEEILDIDILDLLDDEMKKFLTSDSSQDRLKFNAEDLS